MRCGVQGVTSPACAVADSPVCMPGRRQAGARIQAFLRRSNGNNSFVPQMQSAREEGRVSSLGHYRGNLLFPGGAACSPRGPQTYTVRRLWVHLGRLMLVSYAKYL